MNWSNPRSREALREVLAEKQNALYYKSLIPFTGNMSEYKIYDSALKELDHMEEKGIPAALQRRQASVDPAEQQLRAQRSADQLAQNPEQQKGTQQIGKAQEAPYIQVAATIAQGDIHSRAPSI